MAMTTDSDAAADALVERLFGAVVATWDVYAVYLGDRLGYYRSLASEGPASAGELAARVGAQERHTREWLEQQAVSGILEVDDAAAAAEARRYSIPAGHAEVLTDRDSLRYLAPFARAVAACGSQLASLATAYREGGGVAWEDFGDDMREAQGDTNRPWFLAGLGDAIAEIPDVHERLSAGGAIADVGCGMGWSSIAMALAYPSVRVDGFDLDEPSIEGATRYAEETGVADRVQFHSRDAGDAALAGRYDFVTAFECIHDLPYPVAVLGSMRRLAGSAGAVMVMDERVGEHFTAPGDDLERAFYGFSITTCLPDALTFEGSAGTGTVMRPDTLRAYAEEAGFSKTEILPIEHDTFRFYRLYP